MAEQITIIETTPIPEGMTREQFDAWWAENVERPVAEALDVKAAAAGDFWDPRNTDIYSAPAA